MKLPSRKYAIANDPGATHRRGGRPVDPNPYITGSVCLTESQWKYLSLWLPTGNISQALRALIDRAMKFWPAGPFVFGHSRKSGGSE